MENITADKIRKLYLSFFESKGHKVIPSASLIPENDPSVLFTTAGMHPLVPYLLGEKHPEGKRVTNFQKCIRTGDIDDVGDATHCTFFEMLGNWSFGDYFKKDAITWSYEFLTSPEWLNIPKDRLYFTLFEGEDNIPRDNESFEIWKSLGVKEDHLFFLPRENNWWGPAGQTGPCGPDTEMFYDTLKPKCNPNCNPACNCGKYVEIWNNVFMEYNKMSDGTYTLLQQKNVDTGMGLERIFATLLDASSVYNTELFTNIIKKIEEISGLSYNGDKQRSFRIVADHIRTATFILGDEKGIVPSNSDQGYILRRIIRRAIRHLKNLGVTDSVLSSVAMVVINDYSNTYPELEKNRNFIIEELNKEERLFSKTLSQGMREFDKLTERIKEYGLISGEQAFRLYDTYGFPIEFTIELATEAGMKVDINSFEEHFKRHQELSRVGAEKKFKGGLADNSEETTRLHTTAHLLQAALREKFGPTVHQKGSNITPERLRFDFSFDRKLTDEEVKEIQDRVNEVIREKLDVKVEEMSLADAQVSGALGFFTDKYDKQQVKVYSIGNFSKEICGGPHVKNTSELGKFKIIKEEACSAGVRRIKAILEN